MPTQAFISCRLPADDTVENICTMLQPDIVPYISRDVKFGILPNRIRERIAASDCLIIVITETGSSAFVQNEVGIAYALNKPIFAIYKRGMNVGGIQPYLSTFIEFGSEDVTAIAAEIVSLKSAIVNEISSREVGGSVEEILENLARNGIQGIYPDRSTAFRVFEPLWDRERHINIVGSSIEGFKRGIGIEARELLMGKLEKDSDTTMRILLTHSSVAKYREAQERELDGYIVAQIKATTKMLEEVRERTNTGERLTWKFFRGAPTCFMIMAGNFMLLNPYLYMQPAYFNFSMIVSDTKSPFDIYNHYRQYHFQRAWDDPGLSSSDSGLDG